MPDQPETTLADLTESLPEMLRAQLYGGSDTDDAP
jgi:hypothetical protein